MGKKRKITLRETVFWVLGILMCALGLALSTKAAFGLSVIGAAPYVLHVYFHQTFAWFTQGTAEYIWEAAVLLALCLIVRKCRPRYFLSFGTAVIAGFAIDGWLYLLGGNGSFGSLTARVAAFIAGQLITYLAIALLFRTSLPLQVYELAVTEIAAKYALDNSKVKLVFDLTMLILAVLLSVVLLRRLVGIGIGTVISAVCCGPMSAVFGKVIDHRFFRNPSDF